MAEYFLDIEYKSITYGEEEVNFKEFECCTFTKCNFSQCAFVAVTFIDCTFNDCTFSNAKINYVAFRTVTFNKCEIKDVNFAMCDKLILKLRLRIIGFFQVLKLRNFFYQSPASSAVDFMSTDLTEVLFENCDLYRSEFAKAIANKANFKTSFNYTIDPKTTKLKKAVFALEVKRITIQTRH
jgi:uncharacterized protein YjbI with pentapeptide repeats